jgi:MFS family permease
MKQPDINALSGTENPAIAPKTGSAKAWFSIVVIVLLLILSMIDRNAINLMIDPIRKSFGINDFKIGLLQGPAFAVFFLLGSLLMGWMVDKYSNRWLIYIGATIWSAATIASGFSGSFMALLIARCFVGLGESVLQPAGWSMVTKLFPVHKLATAIGTLTAGSQLGVAVSFMLTGYLISEANNGPLINLPGLNHLQPWQWAFVAAGVPGLFLALLIFILPANTGKRNKADKQTPGKLGSFIRENHRFLLCHFAGFGLLSIMMNGAVAWGPAYLVRTHGMEVKNIGLLLGAAAVPLSIGGVIFAGWLVDRYFKRGRYGAHLQHFAVRAMLIAILGGIGFTFDSALIIPLICFGFIQFLQPFSGVAGASLQVSVPEQYRGRISAIFIMWYNAAGMMLGPSFVALLSSWLGQGKLGMAIAINYVILGGVAAIMLWIGRRYAAAAYRQYNYAGDK